MSLGLLQWRSNEDIEAEEASRRAEQEAAQKQLQMETALAGHIRRCWESAKQQKREVEERMLDCLRRVKGEYSQEQLKAIEQQGGSKVYMMITATKTRAAQAWIQDILMPVNERPWGLSPTPIADIPPAFMQQLQQQVMQEMATMTQQGEQITPQLKQQLTQQAQDRLRKEAQEASAEAADKMERLIEDQLAEGDWKESLEQFISDFAIFPAAIIKGPTLRRHKALAWADGWQPVKVDEIRPGFERVSPFDFYPSPDATGIDDGAYLIERVRYRRADLQSMLRVEGYDDQSIRDALREYGQGGLRDWLWTDGERARLEGRQHDLLSPAETIDGLHYWGAAQGLQLLQWGMRPDEIPDPTAEYQVEAILIGRHCVRCVINDDPMERRPYGKASFQPVPGSFWGTGIPELMADIQDVCNAAARGLINNLAISSGPQIDVSMDRLAPGEDPTDIYPWKIWRTRQGMAAQGTTNPAIRFFQPNSNASELLAVYETFEQKADDATNIPRYLYGNEAAGGAGNTASGLSMLMESANKGIKAAIGHIDTGVLKRMVEAMWLHNMLYSDDISVKGDCKVIPRGSNAMLQRERTQMMQQQLFQHLANPQIVQQALGIKGQVKLLRKVTEGAGIEGLVPEGVEDQIEQQSQQPSPEQQLSIAELQAKIQKLQNESQRIAAQAAKEQAETQQKLPEEAKKLKAEVDQIHADIQQTLSEIQHAEDGRLAPPPRPAAARTNGGTGTTSSAWLGGNEGLARQSAMPRRGLSGPSRRSSEYISSPRQSSVTQPNAGRPASGQGYR